MAECHGRAKCEQTYFSTLALLRAEQDALKAANQRIAELTNVSDEAVKRGMETAKSRVSNLTHRRFAEDLFSNHRFVLEGAIRAALGAYVRG